MARDQRKRQQVLQRNAAKRKQKQHSPAHSSAGAPRASLPSAGSWPIHECLVSRDWEKEGEIVQIIVARRSPLDQIAAALFLVDPACLGVKDAFVRLLSPVEYEQELRPGATARQRMTSIDLNLAAKILRDCIAYAHGLGFSPHPDYAQAAQMLDGADPDAAKQRVPVGGKDGKPYFIAGPHDNVARILAQLDKAVGPGNFQYTVPIGPGALPF